MSDHPNPFDFVAGQLSLDFVNTVANRLDAKRSRDLLATPANLERWFRAAGIALRRGTGDTDIRAARRLREHLYALFAAAARGGSFDATALNAVDTLWRRLHVQRKLILAGGRVTYGWSARATPFQRAIHPILASAIELLESDQLGRVRQCEGEGCGWLFLDRSRGLPRRWCSMRDCGNRAKARRHYLRVAKPG